VVFVFAAWQAATQEWAGSRLWMQSFSHWPTVVELQVEVLEPPLGAEQRWTFPGRVVAWKVEGEERGMDALVRVRWRGEPPEYGDIVAGRGRLQPLAAPRNPGERDSARMAQARGIWLEWSVQNPGDAVVALRGGGSPILRWAGKARAHLQELLGAGLEHAPEARALLSAMTLGDVSGLSEARLQDFRLTGTLHLFSVSGLHVGMLGVLFWFGLKPLRLPPVAQVLLVIALLFFYATITGLRPASVRAAGMAALVLGGLLINRPATALNSWAAAGFIILLLNPPLLFQPGFQLSFLVVLSILLLGVPLARVVQKWGEPDSFLPVQLYRPVDHMQLWWARNGGGLVAVSCSAWLGSLPLIAGLYHLVSFSAVPVNLLAVPLAFCVLAVAMLSLTTGVVSLTLAEIFNSTNWVLCSLLLGLTQWAAGWSWGSWRVGAWSVSPPPAAAVIFDLGPGEANALNLQGRVFLIDTGNTFAWSRTVRPLLWQKGIGNLDGLFLTHGDAQHIGGAQAAVEEFAPGFVGVPALRDRSSTMRALREFLPEAEVPKRILRAGDAWPVSADWRVSVLYPPPGIGPARADDRGLVTHWQGPGLALLFLQDAGLVAQDWMLRHKSAALAADILIVGRSGDGSAPGEEFLRAVAPRAIVAATADFPRSERLPPGWLRMVQSMGIELLRQDETGAVEMRFARRRVSLRGFLPPHREVAWEVGREGEVKAE
jgi:competence protein ComEC